MAARYGWRGACVGWALLQLAVALPLNASLPRAPAQLPPDDPAVPAAAGTSTATAEPAHASRTMALLAFVFAATWFTSTAMAAHLPRLLEAAGASLAVAVGIGALVGPSQVAGRLLEFGFLRRWHPLWSARLAAATHPLGVVGLLALGPAAAPVFAVLLGNGAFMFISKETITQKMSIKERMMQEVSRSIEVAYAINPVLEGYHMKVEVHADINGSEAFKSNIALKEAAGYVSGMGFMFKAKPQAFASSSCANKIVQ